MDVTKAGLNKPYTVKDYTNKPIKQPHDKKPQSTINNSDEPEVIVELSKSAKIAGLTAVNLDASGSLEFTKTDLRVRVDPEALFEAARFHNGTVEEHISTGLSDMMRKSEANLTAIQLGRMINSAAANNGATIEERAVNREIGIRLAEHFANAHFDDADKRDAFIETIREFAERDAMLDKGYYRWGDQLFESFKPPPGDIALSLAENDRPWDDEAVEAFEANKQEVTDRIAKAVATVSDDAVASRLESLVEKFGMITDTVNEEDPLGYLQWVLDILNSRHY